MMDEAGDAPGARAQAKYGSLVGYCIVRHETEEPALGGREIEMLRGWFEEGMGIGLAGNGDGWVAENTEGVFEDW